MLSSGEESDTSQESSVDASDDSSESLSSEEISDEFSEISHPHSEETSEFSQAQHPDNGKIIGILIAVGTFTALTAATVIIKRRIIK